jgi:hypothetical protein
MLLLRLFVGRRMDGAGMAHATLPLCGTWDRSRNESIPEEM